MDFSLQENAHYTEMGFGLLIKYFRGPFFLDFCLREGISCFEFVKRRIFDCKGMQKVPLTYLLLLQSAYQSS